MIIFAGIVTYNPNVNRLFQCIRSIKDSVARVLIFDNASMNISEIETMVKHKSNGFNNVTLLKSETNIGLASALQTILTMSKEAHADWIMTLDQDSICPPNFIKSLCSNCKEDVAIVAPVYYDKRRSFKKPIEKNETKQIDFCITSGSLNNVEIIESIGGFDTNLFIGLIDNDLCYRLRSRGFLIIEDESVVLDHELGNVFPSKLKKAFLWLYRITRIPLFLKMSYKRIISPMRTKFAIRNMIYLQAKHSNSRVKDWSKQTLRKTIFSSLLRSHFRKDVRMAIKCGKCEGKRMVNELLVVNK